MHWDIATEQALMAAGHTSTEYAAIYFLPFRTKFYNIWLYMACTRHIFISVDALRCYFGHARLEPRDACF